MHLHFERVEKPSSYCDCSISSLSWMGKVPDPGTVDHGQENNNGHNNSTNVTMNNQPSTSHQEQSSNHDSEGWKLNRNQYYSDGWLATGNVRGIVGVTFTTCSCINKKLSEDHNNLPPRTNYNLRGHRSEVTIVKWNEPYQKLATCDSSGIIFVWIKYEGRWSIELINDRSTQVTDFNWSHDGRMAVICYTDGFVLVGSVTGQRFWSSMLNLDTTIYGQRDFNHGRRGSNGTNRRGSGSSGRASDGSVRNNSLNFEQAAMASGAKVTCGIWSPDDTVTLFGTSHGHVIVIQVNGTVVTQVQVRSGVAISSMLWSCERFKMEDGSLPGDNGGGWPREFRRSSAQRPPDGGLNDSGTDLNRVDNNYTLAIAFVDGTIYLMKSYDDLCPVVINTGLQSLSMEWSNHGTTLAVGGHVKMSNPRFIQSQLFNPTNGHVSNPAQTSSSSSGHSGTPSSANANGPPQPCLFLNSIQMYTELGTLRYRTPVSFTLNPITSLTWGHNDRRLFIATGPVLHIAWVCSKVPSLQLLSRLAIFKSVQNESSLKELLLPNRLSAMIMSLFSRTLRCYLPRMDNLRHFITVPPVDGTRLHCTLIRHDEELITGSVTYILYLEYLGGLVPILKGKRASKLKPEFVIFDPEIQTDCIDGTGIDGGKIIVKSRHCPDGGINLTADQSVTNVKQSGSKIKSFISNSVPNTPLLGRRKKPNHGNGSSSNPLYWNGGGGGQSSSSGQESDGGGSDCESSSASVYESIIQPRDPYGHVYSLPSPILMRRKMGGHGRWKLGGGSNRGNNNTDDTADGSAGYINGTGHQPHVPLIPAVGTQAHNDPGNELDPNSEATISATITGFTKPESTYCDEMPERNKLLLVTSNIWGTRFKILSLANHLPPNIGTIIYRTSLLHLQPRQMTLNIKELGSAVTDGKADNGGKKLIKKIVTSPLRSIVSSPVVGDGGNWEEEYTEAINSSNFCPIAPMTPIHRRGHHGGRRRTRSPVNVSAIVQRHHDQQEDLERKRNDVLRSLGSSKMFYHRSPEHRARSLSLCPTTERPSHLQIKTNGQDIGQSCSRQALSQWQRNGSLPDGNFSDYLSSFLSRNSYRNDVLAVITPSASSSCSKTINGSFTSCPSTPLKQSHCDQFYNHHSKKRVAEHQSINDGSEPIRPLIDHTTNTQVIDFNQSLNLIGDHSITSDDLFAQIAQRFANELALLSRSPIKTPTTVPCSSSDRDRQEEEEVLIVTTDGDRRGSSDKHVRSMIQIDSSLSQLQSLLSTDDGKSSNGHPSTPARCLDNNFLSALPPSAKSPSIRFIDDGDLAIGPPSPAPSTTTLSQCVTKYQSKNSPTSVASTEIGFQNVWDRNPAEIKRLVLQPGIKRTAGSQPEGGGQRSKKHKIKCTSLDCNEDDEDGGQELACACDLDSDDDDDSPLESGIFKKCTDIDGRKLAMANVLASPVHRPTAKWNRNRESDLDPYDSYLRIDSVTGGHHADGQQSITTCYNGAIASSDLDTSDDEMSIRGSTANRLRTRNENGRSRTGRRILMPRIPNIFSNVFGRAPRGGGGVPLDCQLSVEVQGPGGQSLPTSPMHQRQRKERRGLFYSPLVIRRAVRRHSDDESGHRDDNDFDDVKRSLLKGLRTSTAAGSCTKKGKRRGSSNKVQPDSSPFKEVTEAEEEPVYKEFVLQNKAPFWNEGSQVYQLDFGGRVTQESAKNFQIEHNGNQVMQFGRIDTNAYTLDFQYPFSALQALAVALANVTQRLK